MALSPEVLAWARRTAGLSPAAAASKLRFRDTKRRTASERLQAMESGAERPSRSVLKRMVKAYHQPLVVFYMSQPPEDYLIDDAFRIWGFFVPERRDAAAPSPLVDPVEDRWSAAMRSAHTLPCVDSASTSVIGISEGGTSAVRVSNLLAESTHVASLQGGGPNRMHVAAECVRRRGLDAEEPA